MLRGGKPPAVKTFGLLIGLWLVCGLLAEAMALKDRPFKPNYVLWGPIALAQQLEWI